MPFPTRCSKLTRMTQPLALVVYERLLPGSQVVNKLQDLNYRVQTVAEAGALVERAERERPIVVLADLGGAKADIYGAIVRLRQNPPTKHVPVIGFGGNRSARQQSAAMAAGLTLAVSDAAILSHLREFLDQALQVD